MMLCGCLVAQSCLTLCDPMDCSSCHLPIRDTQVPCKSDLEVLSEIPTALLFQVIRCKSWRCLPDELLPNSRKTEFQIGTNLWL